MLDLNSPRWRELRDAYGAAQDIPHALRELADRSSSGVWEKLWSALCHQGTVYSATYASIPHVVAIAERQSLPDQVDYWSFVGAVAAATRASAAPPDLRGDYEAALDRSAPWIMRLLASQPKDRSSVVYLLAAMAAVRGAGDLASLLEGIVDEELTGRCPACSVDVRIEPTGEGVRIAAEDSESWMEALEPPAGAPTLTDIKPETCPTWLPQLAHASGHPDLARIIATLFGRARCPSCGDAFSLLEELQRQAAE